MPKNETERIIRDFIVDNYVYRTGGDAIDREDSFLALGLIDSVGILELVAFVEEMFSIRMADEDLIPENLDSIARLTAYIERKLATRLPNMS
jgi:acyl carrier protein